MTILDTPSAASPLDVLRFPTASLPLATLPLTGNELITLLQGGRNVYTPIIDLASLISSLTTGLTHQQVMTRVSLGF